MLCSTRAATARPLRLRRLLLPPLLANGQSTNILAILIVPQEELVRLLTYHCDPLHDCVEALAVTTLHA